MKPIEPPRQAIKEWIPHDESNLSTGSTDPGVPPPPSNSDPEVFDRSPMWPSPFPRPPVRPPPSFNGLYPTIKFLAAILVYPFFLSFWKPVRIAYTRLFSIRENLTAAVPK